MNKIENWFPKDFLWGSSTSSFQVEGASTADGKGVTVMDLRENDGSICGYDIASDHYNHVEEDVKLMKELGLKAYRFSISWARILPEGEGEINQTGLNFYHKLIDLLNENGIKPIVTMYHFDYPQALVEKYGGWISRKSIDNFVDYAKVLFNAFGDKVDTWLTINEQDHVTHMPYRLGLNKEALGIDETQRLGFQANHHMCVATAKVIELCHKLFPKSIIGPAVSFNATYAATSRPEDALAAQTNREIRDYYLLDLHCRGEYNPIFKKYLEDRNRFPIVELEDFEIMKDNRPDFIGVNYYSSNAVEFFPSDEENPIGSMISPKLPIAEAGVYKVVKNKHVGATDWGWQIDPIGLRIVLRDIYNRYGLPMIITENGFGANEDEITDTYVEDNDRIDYLQSHLLQINELINEGIPVFGYCNWSFIDLVSGHDGFRKRYGLVKVDRTDKKINTMNRYKKKSFFWYQGVIETNGEKLLKGE